MLGAEFECFKPRVNAVACAAAGGFEVYKEIDSEAEPKTRYIAPIACVERKTKQKCCVCEDCLGCVVSTIVVFLNETNQVDDSELELRKLLASSVCV